MYSDLAWAWAYQESAKILFQSLVNKLCWGQFLVCTGRQWFSLELQTALFTELCIPPPPRWSDHLTDFVLIWQLDLQAEHILCSPTHLSFCGFRYDSPRELLKLFRTCCLKDSGPAQPCRNSTPTWWKIALLVQLHSIERDAMPLLDFVAELPNEASFAPRCEVQHIAVVVVDYHCTCSYMRIDAVYVYQRSTYCSVYIYII